MQRNLLCSLALLALVPSVGCQSPKAPATDTFESFDSVDQKSDSFSNRMRIVGTLTYGETSSPVSYTSSPLYRAFKFVGATNDKVDITVNSDDGDAMAWLLDANFRTIAKNDDDADGGTLDSHITATLTANKTASNHGYYIVFRDYNRSSATFTVTLKNTAPNFYACNVDSDCVKVAAECCTNLGSTAVAKNEAAAFQASLMCSTKHYLCPYIELKDDHSQAECNTATNKCELVLPANIACGGHTINNHVCPTGFSCQGDALASDGTGSCYQSCGGIAGLGCDDFNATCYDNPFDSCDPAHGGADCGGLCATACPTILICLPSQTWDPIRCACVKKTGPVTHCGGIAGGGCLVGQKCVDDPSDSCDPAHGGADCPGICQ